MNSACSPLKLEGSFAKKHPREHYCSGLPAVSAVIQTGQPRTRLWYRKKTDRPHTRSRGTVACQNHSADFTRKRASFENHKLWDECANLKPCVHTLCYCFFWSGRVASRRIWRFRFNKHLTLSVQKNEGTTVSQQLQRHRLHYVAFERAFLRGYSVFGLDHVNIISWFQILGWALVSTFRNLIANWILWH